MSIRKCVKILQDTTKERLVEDINALMKEDMNWNLITIDSQEQRSLGVGVFLFTAWLQYERGV